MEFVSRSDRTATPSARDRTMTGEALRFMAGRRAPAIGVRVVAGHAAQVSLARRVTPAPG